MTMTDVELRSGPSLDDIREWGRQNGFDNVPESGRLPKGLRAAFNDAHGMEPRATAVHAETVSERAPQIKRETLTDRVRGAVTRTKKPARGRVKVKKPRVSIETTVEFIWGVMADIAKPVNTPVSKVLKLQAPVAGMVLEENMKNKMVDRVLQPFARMEEGGKVWGALMGPPMLVALISKYPQTAPKAIPVLQKSLAWWLDVAGPQIEEKQRREEEFTTVYGEKVDAMILSFFPELFVIEDDVQPN
jgi:hypothetical protein